uniref:heme d1 biosynthesis radical SAM protein NirJ1 n=1 Tax=Akkermansia muciniphila TaxID=239935 RepID=UPI003FD7C42F
PPKAHPDRPTRHALPPTTTSTAPRITPAAPARFKELGVAYVGISLDGIGAVHDKFRGVEGSFEQAVRGFKLCSEVGQKTGLRLTLTRNNVQCMGQILDFIDANDIQRVCFYHLVPTGRGVEVQTLTQEEARNAMDTLIARVEEWKAEGKNREVLTVTQPADGIYLLLRQLREGSPLAKETLGLLQWNGGGANSSGRGIANIDTQGAVHPDQFWQSVTLGNVKSDRFSDLWDARAGAAVEMLPELRGSDDPLERQKKIEGRCGRCAHFALCGGGFRTRAAFAHGHWYGSDPGCYLTEEEISTPLPEIR